MAQDRVHKILAQAGYASRRKAEEWVLCGRVTVNGKVVTRPGCTADPEVDTICLDGKPVERPVNRIVLMLYKPRGVLTTMHDPQGRPTVSDLIPIGSRRLFPVGRLDADSEGLLLMTDDGYLSLHVQHPRFGIAKTYDVEVRGLRDRDQLTRLRKGVTVQGNRFAPAEVELRGRNPGSAWLRIRIAEGKKREVRRMCAEIHLGVLRLKRVAIGGLWLGSLRPGEHRIVTPAEIRRLLGGRIEDPGTVVPSPAPRKRARSVISVPGRSRS